MLGRCFLIAHRGLKELHVLQSVVACHEFGAKGGITQLGNLRIASDRVVGTSSRAGTPRNYRSGRPGVGDRLALVRWLIAGAVLAVALLPGAELPPAATDVVDFADDVQPLFERRCYACHGEASAMNGLRLDRKDDALAGGHSGPAIIPGNSADSRLIHMVAGHEVKVLMPPVAEPLSVAEIGMLRGWIDQGAEWSDASSPDNTGSSGSDPSQHWAFQPIRRPDVPQGEHPVDYFVRHRLRQEGIQPSPRASPAELLTRVSLDTTGLIPTLDEQRAFLGDGRDGAYERVVDRLLASDHFGEKQAMHWLDQVRYADSDGYAKDYTRPHAWRYRRWVIDAINSGMPFDRFSIEQIAGDLLPDATVDQRVATGFHRNTLRNREGGVNPEQYAFEETVDRTSTVGTVWLGLTVGCAQCHDHKYDPISQQEFYQLFAYFDNLWEDRIYAPIAGELGPYLKTVNEYRRKHQEVLDEYDVPAIQAAWERDCIKAGESPGVYLDYDLAWQELGLNTDGGQEIVRIPPSERTWRQTNEVTYYFLRAYSLIVGNKESKELGFPEALRKLKELNAEYPQRSEARIVYENPDPQPTFLRVRGSWDRQGVGVVPSTPAVLPGAKEAELTRLDLARWLFSPDNPLTARVAVNRIWQEYFGRGIVFTSDDFGKQGELPSHPELLDWLAAEFRDADWNVKHLHKLIVTSETYKQSSHARGDLAIRDPNNALLARQSRLRLPAELLWDRALSASALLHHEVGGPSFRPLMPEGSTGFKSGGTDWTPTVGKERFKRGLYIQFQRTQPYPFLMAFDSPDFRAPACDRERSNTPLQALNLLNDETFAETWQALAIRILTEAPSDSFDDRIAVAYRLALGRQPTAGEANRFSVYVARRKADAERQPDMLDPLPAVDGIPRRDLAAWTGVGRVLMNLDEFVTRP